MIKEILYTMALNDNGQLVHIKDAVKGNKYYCPFCKNEFILRNSGKKGKGSKRPHFAHNELTSNCTPESYLHFTSKKLIIDLLEKFINEKKPLLVQWNCPDCSKNNQGNLLAKADSIREEYYLKVCQPDIAILDAKENVIAVIEIVVTHKPDEKTILFYQEQKIILIQLNMVSEEDLNNIERKVTNPDLIDFCFNNNCNKFHRSQINRKVISSAGQCGRCYHQIEKFYVKVQSALGDYNTLDFTDDEINIVKSHRTNVEIKFNNSTKHKFPITPCNHCKAIEAATFVRTLS